MELKKIIAESGFKFNKRFGQNFIDNDELLTKIVASSGVEQGDTVLEIGAGGGTLTKKLAEKSKKVYAFEIDKNLKPVLTKTLDGVKNAQVFFEDFMRSDLAAFEARIDGEYVVVANIPYYITSPIVMKLIEESTKCKRIVVMIQKEVADRFCATPSTAEYGAITAAIAIWGKAKTILNVSRDYFYPRPEVDSAVVRIDKSYADIGLESKKAYRAIVRAAFSSRRKTLANNLMNTFKLSRPEAENLLRSCSIDEKARGETLDFETFVTLSNAAVKIIKNIE